MKYKVLFDIQFFNGSSIFESKEFDTKGRGKKVLRAHIKKYIEDFYSWSEHTVDVRVVYIHRYDELNFNNVWPKEDFEKFKDKEYRKNRG